MKIRKELSGIHVFDRSTGLHILVDEFRLPFHECCNSPRTVSIALTNVCDLECHFCYVPKTKDCLAIEYVKMLALKLDKLGVLEVTFGGGEPLLYPDLDELCKWIWKNTDLGINITTNGHHLNDGMIEKLEGVVSSLRFSIDGVEPYYSQIRNKPLERLLQIVSKVQTRIPTGFNVTVCPGEAGELENVIELALSLGVDDVLIIPVREMGKFVFSKSDWMEIEHIINKYQNTLQLLITYDAAEYMDIDTLATEKSHDYLFAHISADMRLKVDSYSVSGELVEDPEQLQSALARLRPNHRR